MLSKFGDIEGIARRLDTMKRCDSSQVTQHTIADMLHKAQVSDQRAQLAGMAMQGLLSNPAVVQDFSSVQGYEDAPDGVTSESIVASAARFADALLRTLEKICEP